MHGSVGFNHLTRIGFESRATVTNSLAEWMDADLFNSQENADANCYTLFSEDFKDGQFIDGRLRVVNPFREDC